MDRSPYLHVHLPGRGRVTLSLPAGVERAIISGKLTADAQVWYEQLNLWVGISRHPEMAPILSLVQLPPSMPPISLESPELMELELPPDVESAAPMVTDDPTQLPLIPLEDLDQFHEFSEFLKRSSDPKGRRLTVRSSGPVRASGPARVVVAGAPEPRKEASSLRRLVPRYLVPGWAAAIALSLLSALAVGLFLLGRFSGGNDLAAVTPVTSSPDFGYGGNQDFSASMASLVMPNPLATEERELENNLRIAEAVVWQPAIDFTPDLIWRSARKVDAVRNSISLYRIAAWRLIDSVSRDGNPALEPYEEAERVDEVLNLVQTAVALLDSLLPSFRVNGELLVFSDPVPAARYSWLRQRADSLFRTPVATDSVPLVRAPRRVVTRLLETLPTAIVQTP